MNLAALKKSSIQIRIKNFLHEFEFKLMTKCKMNIPLEVNWTKKNKVVKKLKTKNLEGNFTKYVARKTLVAFKACNK